MFQAAATAGAELPRLWRRGGRGRVSGRLAAAAMVHAASSSRWQMAAVVALVKMARTATAGGWLGARAILTSTGLRRARDRHASRRPAWRVSARLHTACVFPSRLCWRRATAPRLRVVLLQRCKTKPAQGSSSQGICYTGFGVTATQAGRGAAGVSLGASFATIRLTPVAGRSPAAANTMPARPRRPSGSWPRAGVRQC